MFHELELAWSAGFYDGEGCLSADCTGPKKPRLKLCISQKDIRPLQRFADALGGKIYGPYDSKNIHQLQLNGKHAQKAIRELWPYLCEPKREQVERAYTKAGIVYDF